MKRNSKEWTTLCIRLPKELDKMIIDEAMETIVDTKTTVVLKILEEHYKNKEGN